MHPKSSPWQHLLWVTLKVYSPVGSDFGMSRAEETGEILCQMTQHILPRFFCRLFILEASTGG